jgi:hypothetical protein
MSSNPDRSDDLLLVGLLQPSSHGGFTAREVQTATFARLLQASTQGAGPINVTNDILQRLLEAALVKQTKKRFSLTAAGQRRAHVFLGVSGKLGPTKWDHLYRRFLTAKALGIEAALSPQARERLGDVNGLRYELVRQGLQLELEPVPPRKALIEALGWALLERGASADVVRRARSAKKSFAVGALIDVLCLSAAGVGSYYPEQGIPTLAAHFAGSPSRKAEALYRAVVFRLLASPSEALSVDERPSDSLESFVQRVHRAARASETGRFGERLVFISHVWRELKRVGDTCELIPFKERLAEAYRARHVRLAKADMPQTLRPVDVADSKIRDRDVDLVFVEL